MNYEAKNKQQKYSCANYEEDFHKSYGGQYFSFEFYKNYCNMMNYETRISNTSEHLMDDFIEYSFAFYKFQSFSHFLSNKTKNEKFANFANDISQYILLIQKNKNTFFQKGDALYKVISNTKIKLMYFKNMKEVHQYLMQDKFNWMLGVRLHKEKYLPGIPVYFVNNMIQLLRDLDDKAFQNKRGFYEEQVAANCIAGILGKIQKHNILDSGKYSFNGNKGEIDLILETEESVYLFEIKTQINNSINWNIDNYEYLNFQKGIEQLKKAKKFIESKTQKKIYKILVTSTFIKDHSFMEMAHKNNTCTIEINTLINWVIAIRFLDIKYEEHSKFFFKLLESQHLSGNKMVFLEQARKGNIKKLMNNKDKAQLLISKGRTSALIHNTLRNFQKQNGVKKTEAIMQHIFQFGEATFNNQLDDPDIKKNKKTI